MIVLLFMLCSIFTMSAQLPLCQSDSFFHVEYPNHYIIGEEDYTKAPVLYTGYQFIFGEDSTFSNVEYHPVKSLYMEVSSYGLHDMTVFNKYVVKLIDYVGDWEYEGTVFILYKESTGYIVVTYRKTKLLRIQYISHHGVGYVCHCK